MHLGKSLLPSLAIFATVALGSLQATPITVVFVGPQLPPTSASVPLPFLLSGGVGNPDILFLKFKVPDIANVVAINSFVLTIDLADDNDGGSESWHIDFAQPSTNLSLLVFPPVNIKDYTPGSPLHLVLPLCSCEIDQVLPSMLDGNFRIKIQRDTGDFYVVGGSVEIDATLAPEPASAFLVGIGLVILAGLARKQHRAANVN
ncbi:MAG: hypothetical protein ABI824_09870 [Acidobacteriota bacterium]